MLKTFQFLDKTASETAQALQRQHREISSLLGSKLCLRLRKRDGASESRTSPKVIALRACVQHACVLDSLHTYTPPSLAHVCVLVGYTDLEVYKPFCFKTKLRLRLRERVKDITEGQSLAGVCSTRMCA